MSDINVLLERLERLLENVHQYVGARYVPNFIEGGWDETQAYEALDVVDNGQGTSYIAKKPVPAGTPLSNREYWFVYGATSGAIINLQQQIDAIVNKLQKKDNIIIFGDSWTDATADVNVQAKTVLEKMFDATVKSYGKSGTGFDVANGYDEQINWFAADDYDHNTIKCIILVCGLNEYNMDPTATSKEDFLVKLEDWYDKLVAVCGDEIPVYWFHNYSIENDLTIQNYTTFTAQYNYYKYVMENCTKPIIMPDTFAWVDSWRNDRHPDADGSTEFYENVGRCIQGVKPLRTTYQTVDISINSDKLHADYYYNDSDTLDCEIYGNLSLVSGLTSATSATYDHNPPNRIANNSVINIGAYIDTSNYAGFSFHPITGVLSNWSIYGVFRNTIKLS